MVLIDSADCVFFRHQQNSHLRCSGIRLCGWRARNHHEFIGSSEVVAVSVSVVRVNAWFGVCLCVAMLCIVYTNGIFVIKCHNMKYNVLGPNRKS